MFFLVGIWHGANGKYIAFGVWNGGIIMISTILEPVFDATNKKLRINTEATWFRVFQMMRTFVVVLVGYVFDVAPDFKSSMRTFRLALTDWNMSVGVEQVKNIGVDIFDYALIVAGGLVMFFVSRNQEKNQSEPLRVRLDKKPFIYRYVLLMVLCAMIIFFGIYGPGYDAAEFVYMQF